MRCHSQIIHSMQFESHLFVTLENIHHILMLSEHIRILVAVGDNEKKTQEDALDYDFPHHGGGFC